MKLMQYDKLIAVMHEEGTRDGDGFLVNPPELFVSVYNEERDRYEVCPIAWSTADALAPRQMKCLRDELVMERNARAMRREQEAQAAAVDEKIAAALADLPPGALVADAHMAASRNVSGFVRRS